MIVPYAERISLAKVTTPFTVDSHTNVLHYVGCVRFRVELASVYD